MAHGPYEQPEINWATARVALRWAYRAAEFAFRYDELEFCQRKHPDLFADAAASAARKRHHLAVAAEHTETAQRCIRALLDHEAKETPDGEREHPPAGG